MPDSKDLEASVCQEPMKDKILYIKDFINFQQAFYSKKV